MARTNYVRGREKEYDVRNTLEGAGYTCTRSASSQGLWDVVCARGDEVRFIQSKLTSSGDFSEDANCALLRDLPLPPCAHKEIWLYEAGKGLVEVRDLREPKPDARTAEGKERREVARIRAQHIRALKRRTGT